MDTTDEELLVADEEPDVGVLLQTYEETINDLSDWLDQRQTDWNTRRNIWSGKSSSRDFKKHTTDSETGRVFPFEGAADHEVYDVDDHIRSTKAMLKRSLKMASVNAKPIGHEDTEQAALNAQYMRWVMETKMPDFNKQADLALENWLEKSVMIQYVYWESVDQNQMVTVTLNDLLRLGIQQDVLMSGAADEALAKFMVDRYGIETTKAQEVLEEIRLEGESKFVSVQELYNRPRVRTMQPDEDVFLPPNTIDPQDSPYVFMDVTMTAEKVVATGEKEGWNKEFTEKCMEMAQDHGNYQGGMQGENWNIRTKEYFLDNIDVDDGTVRITYCYQRLVDQNNVSGIYCTVIARGVPDLYGKHELLDYAHGQYPFVATPLEQTSKRFYSARSYPEVGASAQSIVKAEQDASIDNLSMSTLPPLLHPPGKRPTRWGPGEQISVFRPDQYQYAPTPPLTGASYAMREEARKMASKYFARADQEADPVEIQNKQQELVDKMMDHFKKVFTQVFSLCQQFGEDEEYFQVVGVQQMQKYSKGDPSQKYDFVLDFDISTLDPERMVDRAKTVGELAGLFGVQGQYDNTELFRITASTLLPGHATQFLLPQAQGVEKAIQEERQAISELVAGVPPNVRPNDAHQIKYQFFNQWKQQPDIQQMLQTNEAFAQRVANYEQQRVYQLQQEQNAMTGRLGAQDTGFGMATENQ